jgi:hypothetical protein
MVKAYKYILAFLLLSLAIFPASADDLAPILKGWAPYNAPINLSRFAMPKDALAVTAPLEGTLRITGQKSTGFSTKVDTYKVTRDKRADVGGLPTFAFEFVQDGTSLIPAQRGMVENSHPYWEWVIEPGRVWQTEGGETRYSVPFALMERGANCLHYGVIAGTLDASGSSTRSLLQISSETCQYLKFNKWAVLETSWQQHKVADAGNIAAAYWAEVANRMPMKPIGALAAMDKSISESRLSQEKLIPAKDMTLYGAVVDGVHYVSGCDTRYGAYPYCEVLPLPSYSVAKSTVGGLALMRLEKLYPGVMDAQVSDYVDACSDKRWQGVTFENLLDMSTGNYSSKSPNADENSGHFAPFFLKIATKSKLEFACSHFKRKTTPGKRWVYHTSDTFILSAAMDSFLKSKLGTEADYYRDLLIPVWRTLGLSPVVDATRRTVGARRLPYAGYGQLFHRNDIARIASELAGSSDDFFAFFDQKELSAALQKNAADRGLKAGDKRLRYNNGFWGWNAKDFVGCKVDTWLPFMSGFGGISVVMMPGGTVYYYFSDSGKHLFGGPVALLSKIKPICGTTS